MMLQICRCAEFRAELRFDNELRGHSFLFIRYLAIQYIEKFSFIHRLTRQNTLTLNLFRRCYNHDGVDAPPSLRLEQQRNVEHDKHCAFIAFSANKLVAFVLDNRMNDFLQRHHGVRIIERQGSQKFAIDPPIDDRLREPRGQRIGHSAGIYLMNAPVGVENSNAEVPEHSRSRRFPHTDRTGQTEDDHALGRSKSCSTNPRKSGVTSGRIPNHLSKAGAA